MWIFLEQFISSLLRSIVYVFSVTQTEIHASSNWENKAVLKRPRGNPSPCVAPPCFCRIEKTEQLHQNKLHLGWRALSTPARILMGDLWHTHTPTKKHLSSNFLSFIPQISSQHKVRHSNIFPPMQRQTVCQSFQASQLLLMISVDACSSHPSWIRRLPLALSLVFDCSRWGCHTLHYREEALRAKVLRL